MAGRRGQRRFLAFGRIWTTNPPLPYNNLGGGYVVVRVAEKHGQPVLPPLGFPLDVLVLFHRSRAMIVWLAGRSKGYINEEDVGKGKHRAKPAWRSG